MAKNKDKGLKKIIDILTEEKYIIEKTEHEDLEVYFKTLSNGK